MLARWVQTLRARRQGLTTGLIITGAVILALGLSGGFLWYATTPTTYTAEARLSVGQQSLSASQIPGYAAATQTLASDYARLVQDTPSFVAGLPGHGFGVLSVSASPIPESSVVRVEVQATRSNEAIAAANATSRWLVDKVGAARPTVRQALSAYQQAYATFRQAESDASAAQSTADRLAQSGAPASSVQAARDSANKAAVTAATRDLEQQALGSVYRDAYTNQATAPELVPIRTASDAASDSSGRLQRDLLIGALAACALLAGGYYFLRRGLEYIGSNGAHATGVKKRLNPSLTDVEGLKDGPTAPTSVGTPEGPVEPVAELNQSSRSSNNDLGQ